MKKRIFSLWTLCLWGGILCLFFFSDEPFSSGSFFGTRLFFKTRPFSGIIATLYAEEGLWLPADPPAAEIKARYGADVDSEFLARLQQCVLRLDIGATGSFVSPNGLVMTNHHCVIAALNRLYSSMPEKNPIQNGFYAPTLREEVPCPDLKLRLMIDCEDVTDRFQEIYRRGEPSQVQAQIAQLTETLVQRGNTEPNLQSQVIHFYRGARSFLIRYRCFHDVRLVFAPEMSVGFFGGESDNFEYPRYNFDAAFLRVYENGQPYRPKEWLSFSRRGAQEGELTLTLGFPARSERFKSTRHLQLLRDLEWPYQLERCRSRQEFLESLRETHPDDYPETASELFRLQNSMKAARGRIDSLHRPEIWQKKLQEGEKRNQIIEWELQNSPNALQNPVLENPLENAVEASVENSVKPRAEQSSSPLDPRERLNQGLALWEENFYAYHFFVLDEAFDSSLYKLAKKMVLWARESEKAPGDRLPGYSDAQLPQKTKDILAHLSIREDLEKEKWIRSLALYRRLSLQAHLFPENDFFKGQTPEAWGTEILEKTRMRDREFRQSLVNQGWAGVQNSDDPLLQFAVWIEKEKSGPARKRQKEALAQINGAYRQLVPAYYRALGASLTPDANFTLRLSYGKIAGYRNRQGVAIPAQTTIGGALAHAEAHQRSGVYALSPKWFDAGENLAQETPLNQISTNDILGGNSGSPLLNARGEIVGLIFDGNFPSLASDFLYSAEEGRAVSVASEGILEVLKNVYHADRLLQELSKAEILNVEKQGK